MPKAVFSAETCIRTSVKAAEEFGLPIERIIFEVIEGEKVDDHTHLREIVEHYKKIGFLTAIDDFGAGHSGLNLLAEFPADFVKLDISLVRNIDKDRTRRAIARGVIQVCADLSIEVIAEGIECYEEMSTLRDLGVELFQGYHFAKPAFQAQATVPQEVYDQPNGRGAQQDAQP